jgi:uncharacterized SAM-binding protein YcdF (DUF218 family)
MSNLPPPPNPSTAVGTIAPPAPADNYTFRGNEMLGIVFGSIAALVCGLLWYFVVTLSDRQFVYLAILLGVGVGKAVAFGSGHSKVVNGIMAIVIAGLGMLGSYYFIDRHILVNQLGADASIPLWDSFSFAKELIKAGLKAEQSQYVFTAIAVALAGFSAFTGTKSAPRLDAY